MVFFSPLAKIDNANSNTQEIKVPGELKLFSLKQRFVGRN